MYNTVSRLLRAIIFLLIIGGLVHTANTVIRNNPQTIATTSQEPLYISSSYQQEQFPELQVPATNDVPVRISIERLDISLAVDPGFYDTVTQTWTLADGKAFFATLSKLPNIENGNTVIYAHNRPDAFSEIRKLVLGDIITVVTSTGKTFVYEYVESEYVNPANDAVFSYDDYPRLTLLTCNGTFNETRLLMYAKLVQVLIN